MQRHLTRVLAVSIYPLLGLAGLMTMSGCAAIPAVNMASSLLKPAQQVQSVASAVSTATTPVPTSTPNQGITPAATPVAYSSPADVVAALAHNLGITLPAPTMDGPAKTPITTDGPLATAQGATATAAR